jgi:hypothetical protein
VDGSGTSGYTITQNSIFSNNLSIDLTTGANGDIAAPVIFTTTLGSVNVVGIACPNCTVELFENSDTDGEGETCVRDTTAGAGTAAEDFGGDGPGRPSPAPSLPLPLGPGAGLS